MVVWWKSIFVPLKLYLKLYLFQCPCSLVVFIKTSSDNYYYLFQKIMYSVTCRLQPLYPQKICSIWSFVPKMFRTNVLWNSQSNNNRWNYLLFRFFGIVNGFSSFCYQTYNRNDKIRDKRRFLQYLKSYNLSLSIDLRLSTKL